MNRILFKSICCLAASLCIVSCERLFMEKETESTPTATFDYLWNCVDRQYAFFDVKHVDWRQVYTEYRPLVYDGMGDDSLFRVMGCMLSLLNDGHVNLTSSFDRSYSDSIYRQMYRQKNIDEDVVALNYLHIADDRYHRTAGFSHHSLRDGKVAYLRYASFQNAIDSSALHYLVRHYAGAEGLILDLRQNGGGLADNVWKLLKLFSNQGQLLYFTQTKSGPAHDAFSKPQPVYAPGKNTSYGNYCKPVAVLTDRGSYSATSFFAICTRAYGNVMLVGDTTGGGLGLPNGGQLPNGWNYRFPITRTLSPDGKNYENGVPPDRLVLLDPAETARGRDNVIEYACDWILGMIP